MEAGQRGMMRATVFNVRSSLIDALCEQETVLSIPLEINLTVENTEEGNVLNWSVNSEEKVEYFTIQRSDNLLDFVDLESLHNCIENGSFYNCSYNDTEPLSIGYYRIVAFLENGSIHFSEIKIGQSDFDIKQISVGPNPFINNIKFYRLDKNLTYQVSVFNNLGHLIKSFDLKNVSEKMIDLSFLDQGLYHLKVSDSKNSVLKTIVKI